jgi:hypothetical protein
LRIHAAGTTRGRRADTPVSGFLDDVARALARPMPRSRAVRILGAALVSAAVPGGSFARSAFGGTSQDTTCRGGCEVPFHTQGQCVRAGRSSGRCQDHGPTFTVCCKFPGVQGTQGTVGVGLCTSRLFPALKPPGGTVCCCPSEYKCGTRPGNPCVCATMLCGRHLKCCRKDQECRRWIDLDSDKRPLPTEEDCLTKCTDGRRCTLNPECCPRDQACCLTRPGVGVAECCAPGKVCRQGVFAGGGLAFLGRKCVSKCPRGTTRCNFRCCRPEQHAFRKRKVLSAASNTMVEVTQCSCVED